MRGARGSRKARQPELSPSRLGRRELRLQAVTERNRLLQFGTEEARRRQAIMEGARQLLAGMKRIQRLNAEIESACWLQAGTKGAQRLKTAEYVSSSLWFKNSEVVGSRIHLERQLLAFHNPEF